ncbi:glycoside hydrolase family 43 protein [Microbacteriaceae bacterium VKM Ac-2855]|nr:glycoside hydrolase family 43 protein [Microbacteriaceae bacterium VKM Ac-2855]
MTVLHNPVLRGFNPDPSIVRVGEDYYIATSTFEWFPGVRLHHSRDLANWHVIGHALDERAGFDLAGIPDSGGVWAPSLSHSGGLFWLAYSIVHSMDGDDKDILNYLVTAPTIDGPWSAPVFLGSRGFDFSFFHDAQPDGSERHYMVGVQWDHRPQSPSFGGLVLEEYLPDEQRMTGRADTLFTSEGLVEGPNLYRVGDHYVLTIAEGGTGWNHGITTARARNLLGPYERDPAPAVLTARDDPGAALQKPGHGELVQAPNGEWLMVHLAARPILHLGERYSILGRETCLQRVVFIDGWLRLRRGGTRACLTVDLEDIVARDKGTAATTTPVSSRGFGDHIDTRRYSTLRSAPDSTVFDLRTRPGWLRLRGGRSAASAFAQSMLAERLPENHIVASTDVDAEPVDHRQAAGLLAWYDRDAWIWLQLTRDEVHGRHLRIVRRAGHATTRSDPIEAPEGIVPMRFELADGILHFEISNSGTWVPIGAPQPAWTLSDDHGDRLRFTGSFAAIRAEDLDGRGWHADFSRLSVTLPMRAPHARINGVSAREQPVPR